MNAIIGMFLGAWSYSLMGWQGLAWAIGIWIALSFVEIVVDAWRS